MGGSDKTNFDKLKFILGCEAWGISFVLFPGVSEPSMNLIYRNWSITRQGKDWMTITKVFSSNAKDPLIVY